MKDHDHDENTGLIWMLPCAIQKTVSMRMGWNAGCLLDRSDLGTTLRWGPDSTTKAFVSVLKILLCIP